MARQLAVSNEPVQVTKVKQGGITGLIAGVSASFDPAKYHVVRGSEAMAADRAVKVMLFGDNGVGKSRTACDLLELGFKVVILLTDYGKGDTDTGVEGSGRETVENWFVDHPEHRDKLDNVRFLRLDYQGIQAFSRDPARLIPDIYTWDPDVIFWDGLTAYQEIEAETEGKDNNDTRAGMDWDAWRATRGATLYPLDRIIGLGNVTTGRPWHVFVTCMEEEKGEYENQPGQGGKIERVLKAGTKRIGPMLNTSARKIARAGFSMVLRVVKKTMGGEDSYYFVSKGQELQIKDRGYKLPESFRGNFYDLWQQYVEPKLVKWVPGGKAIDVKVVEAPKEIEPAAEIEY